MLKETRTKIIPCSACGKLIECNIMTGIATAKCETCRREAQLVSKTKPKTIQVDTWSTAAEIRLIRRLTPETAEKYLNSPQGLLDRVNWGGIDRDKCIKACRDQARFGRS